MEIISAQADIRTGETLIWFVLEWLGRKAVAVHHEATFVTVKCTGDGMLEAPMVWPVPDLEQRHAFFTGQPTAKWGAARGEGINCAHTLRCHRLKTIIREALDIDYQSADRRAHDPIVVLNQAKQPASPMIGHPEDLPGQLTVAEHELVPNLSRNLGGIVWQVPHDAGRR